MAAWIDPGAAGYARQTEIARKMLAGEIDPHLEPNDFSGRTVAEQLLWGGASALCAEIVRMALEHSRLASGRSTLVLDVMAARARP
jgi:hypothetical protein